METTFRIRGLDCAQEVKLLRAQLADAPGMRELGFDVVRGRMAASYDPARISITEMMRRVEATGMKAELWQDDAPHPSSKGRWATAAISGLSVGAAMIFEHQGARSWMIAFSLAAIALAVIYTGRKAIASLRALRFDMNVLMCVSAAGACYLGEWTEGGTLAFLFSIANLLEIWSVERARNAIGALMEQAPKEASVLHGRGAELKITCCGEHHCDNDEAALHEHKMPVGHVSVGALVRVRPGEQIPMDGHVSTGAAGVNQAVITGEAIPVFKQSGDSVYAGTLNTDGLLDIRTSSAAADTTLARIVRMVEESQSRRAPSEQFVEGFARIYTPLVIGLAVIAFLAGPFVFNWTWDHALYQCMMVLLISCPCALVISTPVTIAAALASAARSGVLIKGGSFLEQAGKIRAFAFDKTGVVTTGEPEVVAVEPLAELTAAEVLAIAAQLETGSEHPLAKAVLRAAGLIGTLPRNFRALPGRGAEAVIDGERYWIGNSRLLDEAGVDSNVKQAAEWESKGNTVAFVGAADRVLGLIVFSDQLRPGIVDAVAALKRAGVVESAIVTGDNQQTAEAAARSTGIGRAYGALLPDDKVTHIRALKHEYHVVAMAGDGINDAQAMAESTVGIAMGKRSTDVAMETADVIVMSEDPARLGFLMRHSQRTLSVVKQNLAIAIGSKLAFLALAVFGMANLWMAIAADMGATLLVTFNGLRMLQSKD
ncbi:MAG TPA: cation-translocating P-type ATPase [Bryobacteraceae bacterium]|jgi:Cd2+/Zn2+-exporting ATPase